MAAIAIRRILCLKTQFLVRPLSTMQSIKKNISDYGGWPSKITSDLITSGSCKAIYELNSDLSESGKGFYFNIVSYISYSFLRRSLLVRTNVSGRTWSDCASTKWHKCKRNDDTVAI